MRRPIFCLLVIFSFLFLFKSLCHAEALSVLQEGINQYQMDNYEEAIDLLQQARKENPSSSVAAFYLGLAYKQTNDFQGSLPHFEAASTLKPAVKEAVVEVIDILIRLERVADTHPWIELAEKENIYPAKIAFLKGTVLAKEGKHGEAIKAYEQSKELDKTFTQSADFQIGLSYLADRKYTKAKERFEAAVTQDPLSDLASYARRYQDIVEERSYLERPLRATLGLSVQYDTNMLQEPTPYTGLPDSGEEKSFAMMNTLRLDYVPVFSGPWLFNANYAVSWNPHEKNADTHDMFANTLTLSPGYNFGRFAVNLLGNYTHILRRHPGYRQYSEISSVGPLFRYVVGPGHILEFYGGYTNKHYIDEPLYADEDQNSKQFDSYISYTWLFSTGGILNLKYSYNDENATGNNWVNSGHKFSVNSIYPIWKELRLQASAEVYLQDYKNETSIMAFDHAKRTDRMYTGSFGLVWTLNKYVSLMASYTGTKAYSNIFIYDYDRHIFSTGVEFRY